MYSYGITYQEREGSPVVSTMVTACGPVSAIETLYARYDYHDTEIPEIIAIVRL